MNWWVHVWEAGWPAGWMERQTGSWMDDGQTGSWLDDGQMDGWLDGYWYCIMHSQTLTEDLFKQHFKVSFKQVCSHTHLWSGDLLDKKI